MIPLPPRPCNDQRPARSDSDLLLNVQAGVLPEWLRPRVPALDVDSGADVSDKPEAPAAVVGGLTDPPLPEVKPASTYSESPARMDTPDLPDDIMDPAPAILCMDMAADAASPSTALQTLVDLALEDAQPAAGRVDSAPQDTTFAGGALSKPPPVAASLPPPPEFWVSVPVVTSSASFANTGTVATSAPCR